MRLFDVYLETAWNYAYYKEVYNKRIKIDTSRFKRQDSLLRVFYTNLTLGLIKNWYELS